MNRFGVNRIKREEEEDDGVHTYYIRIEYVYVEFVKSASFVNTRNVKGA
jgi:hypothetical protein